MANLSADLIWELTKGSSSTMVKRCGSGVARQAFSRDPLNLRNQFSRKYEGLVADKAIGVAPGAEGGVTLLTKKSNKANAPSSGVQSATIPKARSTRKTYSAIVNSTTKRGYRPDLRREAVARASAIRKSQKDVKEDRPVKLRGAKAKAAAAAASA